MDFAERKFTILYFGKRRQHTVASCPHNVRRFIMKILMW